MHEFSLAQGLHGQLLDLLRQHQATKILSAEIAVGDRAGVVVDSFLFGFNILAAEDPATHGLELKVSHNSGADLILMRVELI